MTSINSVLGPLDTKNLGFTLMHEHVVMGHGGILQDFPELLHADPIEQLVDDLKEAKKGGVDTIVDATTPDLGRHINMLAEVSRLSGVNIIACAGLWLDIPRLLSSVSSNQLARAFTNDVSKGIGGTDIKAGLLKSASDVGGVTPQAEIVLRAIAQAHHQTGVPIILHSYAPGEVARQQLAILKEEGVPMNRVKVDHSNDTTDLVYLGWILEQGCYLGLDRYPGFNDVSPLDRTKALKALIDRGYASRLCPSHDRPILRLKGENPPMTDDERLKLNPHGYLYIKKAVIPWLEKMGVSEVELNNLCIDGPRNFFDGV